MVFTEIFPEERSPGVAVADAVAGMPDKHLHGSPSVLIEDMALSMPPDSGRNSPSKVPKTADNQQ